jgi:aspartate aminotransferase-like enzyme
MAVSNGKTVDRIDVPWGQVFQPDRLAEALKLKHYEAVTIVHNETSTGAENPIQELAAVVQAISPDTLVLVDAVSSLGGAKIEMDAWGIDFLLTASQCCLALPPGLSLAGASERAMVKAEKVTNRGWYFDLVRMEKHHIQDSMPMTPVMSLIYALDVQMDRILAEGLEARFSRHSEMAKLTQDWCSFRGMEPLALEGYRSKTVSVITNSRKMDIPNLNQFLLQRGMRIANGYGKLKNLTFCIAPMGEIQVKDVEGLLVAMEDFLNQK